MSAEIKGVISDIGEVASVVSTDGEWLYAAW